MATTPAPGRAVAGRRAIVDNSWATATRSPLVRERLPQLSRQVEP